jgi:hypothetical protein
MSGFNLPGGPLPASPWHTQLPPAPGPTGAAYNGQPALPTGWGDWAGGMVARPTEPQLNAGGHSMSMPMGGGMGAGANAAANAQTAPPVPNPVPTTPAGAGNPGQFGLGGAVYAEDPALFSRSYAVSKGLNPNVHTAFGDWFLNFLQQLAPTVFDLNAGQGGQASRDLLSNPGAVLDKLLYGGAGSAFGNLRGYAQQALQGTGSLLPTMNEQNRTKFLNAVDTLSTLGMNPYMQNAYGNRFKDVYLQNQAANQQAVAQGRFGDVQDLWTYLQQANPSFFNYGQ